MCHVSTWTLLQKLIILFTLPAVPVLWCVWHQQYCVSKRCCVDASGFPCTDWSPAGDRAGLAGSTLPVLLCLLAWHRQMRTRIICLENVPAFNVSIVEALVGDVYTVYSFYLSPSDVAFEVLSRQRLFLLLLLRGWAGFLHTEMKLPPQLVVVHQAMCRRSCSCLRRARRLGGSLGSCPGCPSGGVCKSSRGRLIDCLEQGGS